MGGGSGGGNTTTTQKADPWSGVQPYLTSAYQQAAELYKPGAGPQYYPGSTVAPVSGMEQFGTNMMVNATPQIEGAAQSAQWGLTNMINSSQGAAGSGGYYAGQGAAGMGNLAAQTQGGVGGALGAMNSLGAYGSSGVTQQGTGGALDAMGQLNQAGDFQNNPAFQQALQSAIRPVTQNFQEQVMPAIQQGAQGAGQMGGSRQGIAEGIAARGYQDTVGDISANMGNAAYAQGLQALQASGQLGQGLAGMGLGATGQAGQLGQGLANLSGSMQSGMGNLGANMLGTGIQGLGQATALTPTLQGALAAPGQLINQLGQQQTANNQQQIDADVNRWNYNQNLPYSMVSDYLAMLNGAQGGTSVSQQSGGGGSKAMGALGGAASGAAIGSMFGPVGTGVGAAGGALYGLFM